MSELPSREELVRYFALYYASLGWRILPNHGFINGKCTCWKKADCGPSAGKHPRFDEWQLKATTEAGEITKWFKDYWPRSNIGIATGKDSNVFVVDIDQKLGGMAKWEELVKKHGTPPPTPITYTGSGGNHVFFKWPDSVVVPTRSKLFPGIGIDLRGEGGQAVLPPSFNEHGEYMWVEDCAPWEVEVADAPNWLLGYVSSVAVETGKDGERFNVLKALCGAPEGERNQVLVSLASSLRAQDFTYDTALSWILQAADNCDPPYPHDEAVKKVQWAWRKFEPGTSWKNVKKPYEQPIETLEWQSPVDFDEMNLPPFPTDALPGWVKNYVEAVAETTQTPVDLGSLCALSVLATACARKVRVFVTSDWSEPLNLYTATCARPGSRKSAVFRHIVQPVKEWEKLRKAQAEQDSNRVHAQIDLLESQYKSLRSRIGKASNEEQLEILNKAEKIRMDIVKLTKKSVLPDITADDITPQAIKTKLFEQLGRLAILSAEGDVFGMMNGRYQANGEPDVDVYLKGHPGDDIKVNRMSGRAEDVHRPALTIGICTQKKSLRGLLTKTGLSNRGLYARFLYSISEKEFEENTDAEPIPFRVHEVYHKNIFALMNIDYRPSTDEEDTEAPHVLTFSPEAQSLLSEFRVWVNTQCRAGGLLASSDELREWGAKLAGAVVRIAGLLHMAENVIEECPWDWEIDARTMDNARQIGSYFVSHAIAAHEQMEASVSHDLARTILSYIQRNNKDQFTKQDAVRCTKKHGQIVENALLYLMDRGFIRDNSLDGRRRGHLFDVNPKWDKRIPEKEITEGESICPVCSGTGKRTRGQCSMCEGTGRVVDGIK